VGVIDFEAADRLAAVIDPEGAGQYLKIVLIAEGDVFRILQNYCLSYFFAFLGLIHGEHDVADVIDARRVAVVKAWGADIGVGCAVVEQGRVNGVGICCCNGDGASVIDSSGGGVAGAGVLESGVGGSVEDEAELAA